jgi:hypothetical protein
MSIRKIFSFTVFCLVFGLPAFSQLYINEFMARNKTGLTDNKGKYSDWIEIYNSGPEAIDMAGYFFTDTVGDPGKSKIKKGHPDSTTIKSHGYLVFFADGKPGRGIRHLGFKLKKTGEQISLYKKEDQKYILVDQVRYKAQFKDTSYGRVPDGSSKFFYIQTASPGFTNNNSTTGKPAVKNNISKKSDDSE